MAAQGYIHADHKGWEVTVSHVINGVSPQMIDWWWDHITPESYKLWHPTDHVSFEWLYDPAIHGHVGAVQRIKEYLNGLPDSPATFTIRWEENQQTKETIYPHALFACAIGEEDLAGLHITFVHEYASNNAGSQMRSRFFLPPQVPEFLVHGLYEHNKQEMANLSAFLPGLYSSQV